MLRRELSRVFDRRIPCQDEKGRKERFRWYVEILTAQEGERPPDWGCSAGVYWCSHCASWVPEDEGAADVFEDRWGPVCDECVPRVEERMGWPPPY